MNNNFIERYMDIDGKIIIRKLASRIKMIFFAGTKIIFDRVLSVIGLIVLSPLILIISIIIKLDSKGPVFFRQERTGKFGKNFKIFKFRTMVANNDVHNFKEEDKYTTVGKFLRKTSLDEIPQLISIAQGKMSFIGPRPWICDYYKYMNNVQRYRYDVRPGLTGLAQVKGRNCITIFDKINYDLKYIKNYSLSLDIKIIVLTIITVFQAKGVDAGKSGIHKELEDLKNQHYIRNPELLVKKKKNNKKKRKKRKLRNR